MTTITIWAGLAGAAGGLGLLLVLAGLPVLNRPRFAERVAPYVHTAVQAAGTDAAVRQRAPRTLSAAAGIFEPALQAAVSWLERFNAGTSSEEISRRLHQAGLPLSTTDYRLQQLASAAAGAAAAAVGNVIAFATGTFSLLLGIIGVLAAAVLGIYLRDAALSARISRRRQQMLTEFPPVAEMLALAVSAGDTPAGAFDRISRTVRGELAAEFTEVMRRTRAGEPFISSVRTFSAEINVPPVARFLEGVVVAVERGTPLAEVMRAQAADARELAKRELMESAGRKEVGMLIPVVFGILPLTVIFAVLPGMTLLEIGL